MWHYIGSTALAEDDQSTCMPIKVQSAQEWIPSHARRLRGRKLSRKRRGLTYHAVFGQYASPQCAKPALGSRIVDSLRSSISVPGPFCTFLATWGGHAVRMRMPHGQLSPVHSTLSAFPSSHHPLTYNLVSSCDTTYHGGSRRDRGGKVSISKSPHDSVSLTCVPQPR